LAGVLERLTRCLPYGAASRILEMVEESASGTVELQFVEGSIKKWTKRQVESDKRH
jgi:hypothetical protein